MKHQSRRTFLKSASLAVAAPLVLPAEVLGAGGRTSPNEKIGMALIGCGGQGRGNMGNMMGFDEVRYLAVCDPVAAHRAEAKRQVNNRYRNEDCAEYADYREVLERSDIDAVMIATPDHWHSVITVAAAQKGIDVYCEKPETLTVAEGRKMANAIKKYGIVFSGGSQRVIGDYGDLPRLLWGGAIGEIKHVYADCGGPSRDCDLPAQDLPPGIDWELWLGPAPWRPFHGNLIRGGFRDWREYSGGGMTDWGCHRFGAAMFATQTHMTGPVEVLPDDGTTQGRFRKRITWVFENGMHMHHSPVGDIVYEGTEGSLELQRGAIVGTHRKPETRVEIPGYRWFKPWENRGIFGDFIFCVKTRQLPFRCIEAAHRTATLAHLGNIVYWLGRPIKWDPVKEEIIGDPEAAKWLNRPKRAPWTDDDVT